MRLSLRMLMVLVLLIGCGLGWVVHRARVQRDAVAAIEKAGGSVRYDWGLMNRFLESKDRPAWLQRSVDQVGVDYFGSVTWLSGTKVSDQGLVHLERANRPPCIMAPCHVSH